MVRGPKGSASKPLRSSSPAICGEGDHLRGEEIDEQRHEQALALDALDLALAEDLFEEDALVGDVLIDDPEAFFVDGEDEGVAELAEGLERGEGVERGGGFGVLCRDRAPVCIVADGMAAFGEVRARRFGRWRNQLATAGEVEALRLRCGRTVASRSRTEAALRGRGRGSVLRGAALRRGAARAGERRRCAARRGSRRRGAPA